MAAKKTKRLDFAYVQLDNMHPTEGNPRIHSDRQLEQIAKSIRQFGFLQPVVIDRKGRIIAGHGRVEAARMAGLTEVPAVYAEHLTDQEKTAYLIADNKLYEVGEWDENALAEAMRGLEDFSIEVPGFSHEEIMELINPKPEVAEVDVPDSPAKPRSRQGDLWALGEHRVLCGDSTDAACVARLMDGRKADMVLTDPPYGVSYVGKTGDALTIENDALSEDELTSLVSEVFDRCEEVSRPGAYWYATVQAGPLHLLFALDWKKRGILRQIMVWAKDSMVLGHSEYHYQHEPILFGWTEGTRKKNKDRTRTTLWTCPRPKSSQEHPTMKPIELWARAVVDGSRPGETVFDPFLGSGTSVLACEQTGRVCYGLELRPAYVDVIVKRWEDHTGLRAKKIK